MCLVSGMARMTAGRSRVRVPAAVSTVRVPKVVTRGPAAAAPTGQGRGLRDHGLVPRLPRRPGRPGRSLPVSAPFQHACLTYGHPRPRGSRAGDYPSIGSHRCHVSAGRWPPPPWPQRRRAAGCSSPRPAPSRPTRSARPRGPARGPHDHHHRPPQGPRWPRHRPPRHPALRSKARRTAIKPASCGDQTISCVDHRTTRPVSASGDSRRRDADGDLQPARDRDRPR